jgi:hypothetical protein
MQGQLGLRSRGSLLSMHVSPATAENQDPWDVADPTLASLALLERSNGDKLVSRHQFIWGTVVQPAAATCGPREEALPCFRKQNPPFS